MTTYNNEVLEVNEAGPASSVGSGGKRTAPPAQQAPACPPRQKRRAAEGNGGGDGLDPGPVAQPQVAQPRVALPQAVQPQPTAEKQGPDIGLMSAEHFYVVSERRHISSSGCGNGEQAACSHGDQVGSSHGEQAGRGHGEQAGGGHGEQAGGSHGRQDCAHGRQHCAHGHHHCADGEIQGEQDCAHGETHEKNDCIHGEHDCTSTSDEIIEANGGDGPLVDPAKFQQDRMLEILRQFRNRAITLNQRDEEVRKLQTRLCSHAIRARPSESEHFSEARSLEAPVAVVLGSKGCKHYKRNCQIKAECCGKYYDCRLCHDEAESHQIDRFATKFVSCNACGERDMPVGKNCQACGIEFARYFCPHCRLYDDDETKDIYHCEACGICRMGKREEQYHCSKCDSCVPRAVKDTHPCLSNALKRDCPVCQEYMGDSTKQVIYMRCGHAMHAECFSEYTQRNYVCPLCSKSLTDMTSWYAALDARLAQEMPLPGYLGKKRTNILCNDCEVKSRVPYHFKYHKCGKCKGYNTKVLSYEDEDDCPSHDMDRDTPPDRDTGEHVSEKGEARRGESSGAADGMNEVEFRRDAEGEGAIAPAAAGNGPVPPAATTR